VRAFRSSNLATKARCVPRQASDDGAGKMAPKRHTANITTRFHTVNMSRRIVPLKSSRRIKSSISLSGVAAKSSEERAWQAASRARSGPRKHSKRAREAARLSARARTRAIDSYALVDSEN